MIIENIALGKRFEITQTEWDKLSPGKRKAFEVIVADDKNGSQVVEASKPMEEQTNKQTTKVLIPKKKKSNDA